MDEDVGSMTTTLAKPGIINCYGSAEMKEFLSIHKSNWRLVDSHTLFGHAIHSS